MYNSVLTVKDNLRRDSPYFEGITVAGQRKLRLREVIGTDQLTLSNFEYELICKFKVLQVVTLENKRSKVS
jgi:hypothetical protein